MAIAITAQNFQEQLSAQLNAALLHKFPKGRQIVLGKDPTNLQLVALAYNEHRTGGDVNSKLSAQDKQLVWDLRNVFALVQESAVKNGIPKEQVFAQTESFVGHCLAVDPLTHPHANPTNVVSEPHAPTPVITPQHPAQAQKHEGSPHSAGHTHTSSGQHLHSHFDAHSGEGIGYFHAHSSELTAADKKALDGLAAAWKADPTKQIDVTGFAHSDKDKSMADERARSVRGYLVSHHHIPEASITMQDVSTGAPTAHVGYKLVSNQAVTAPLQPTDAAASTMPAGQSAAAPVATQQKPLAERGAEQMVGAIGNIIKAPFEIVGGVAMVAGGLVGGALGVLSGGPRPTFVLNDDTKATLKNIAELVKSQGLDSVVMPLPIDKSVSPQVRAAQEKAIREELRRNGVDDVSFDKRDQNTDATLLGKISVGGTVVPPRSSLKVEQSAATPQQAANVTSGLQSSADRTAQTIAALQQPTSLEQQVASGAGNNTMRLNGPKMAPAAPY